MSNSSRFFRKSDFTASKETLEQLEFSRIQKILVSKAQSPRNKDYFVKLYPKSSFRWLEEHYIRLQNTSGLYKDSAFPKLLFRDLQEWKDKSKLDGQYVTLEGCFSWFHSLMDIYAVQRFLKNNPTLSGYWRGVFSQHKHKPQRIAEFKKIFHEDGSIKTGASEELKRIRVRLQEQEHALYRYFERALRSARTKGILYENEETVIQGFRVLCIRSESKKKQEGVKLGESKSGSITYVLPVECQEISFEIKRLKEEENAELIKILQQFTRWVLEDREHLWWMREIQEEWDRLGSILKFGEEMQGIVPQITENGETQLKKARHPLLWLHMKEQGTSPKPLTVEMHSTQRQIVISGPNAGGKSIALKTVGLLQCMMQAGLPVPLEHGSEMRVFKKIFSDIGDQQSIDNELSTYSHKLKAMQHILASSSSEDLVLIDEFGSGSDPILGGALAAECFENLHNVGVYAVITSHYGNIKILADTLPTAVNACMLFHKKSLSPLYEFRIGQPGSSFTFEVAENKGIPKDLIERARNRVSEENIQYEELISQYQSLRHNLEAEKKAFQRKNQKTHTLKVQLDAKLRAMEEKEARLQERVLATDHQLSLGRKLEQIIRQFDKTNNRKKALDQFKKILAITDLSPVEEKKESKPLFVQKKQFKNYAFQVGEEVVLAGSSKKMTIESIEGKHAKVAFGQMQMKISLSKLEPYTLSAAGKKKQQKKK